MRPLALSGLALTLMAAAGAAGYWTGDRGLALPGNPFTLPWRRSAPGRSLRR